MTDIVTTTNTITITSTDLSKEPVVVTSPATLVYENVDNTSLVLAESSTNVVVLEDVPHTVISAGTQGPQGIQGLPGLNEEDIVYAKRVDFISESILYRGEAAVGSAESASVWRIRKIVIGADGDVTETWASGDANFDKAWTNRASLIYS